MNLPLDVRKCNWDKEGKGQVEPWGRGIELVVSSQDKGHRDKKSTYAQLPAVARPTPLARYLRGKTSLAYIQATGAQVSPSEALVNS
jgi:hypothetical protein